MSHLAEWTKLQNKTNFDVFDVESQKSCDFKCNTYFSKCHISLYSMVVNSHADALALAFSFRPEEAEEETITTKNALN